MTKELYIVSSDKTIPYRNLALEEYLLRNLPKTAVCLYLWQNRHTVVVGRNQNCFAQCDVAALEKSGGFLARRLSGGGAVYHDLGNLNFTFLACGDHYNLDRQFEVIQQALLGLGLQVEKSGRNDLTIEGFKFSGNAFYSTQDRHYHHGTIMVNANIEEMSKYLTVSAEKLKAKGVDSVRARVSNLCAFSPGLTVEQVLQALTCAFEDVYGGQAAGWPDSLLTDAKFAGYTQKYASDEWRYGYRNPFSYEVSRRFSWGEVCVRLNVTGNKVTGAQIFSDAMDSDYIPVWEEAFDGCVFSFDAMSAAIHKAEAKTELQEQMRRDVSNLLQEEVSGGSI